MTALKFVKESLIQIFEMKDLGPLHSFLCVKVVMPRAEPRAYGSLLMCVC